RQELATVTQHILRCPPEVLARVLDHLLAGLADRLAHLERYLAGDGLVALLAQVVGLVQQVDAVEKRRLLPGRKGVLSRSHRLVNLPSRAAADRPDDLARVRATDLDHSVASVSPLTVNQGLPVYYDRGHSYLHATRGPDWPVIA